MDSSAASSQEKRVGTSTPEAELNPHRAKALLAKFKEEMALAKAATDPQEREKHSELVEKIKRILIRYQEQQKQAKNNSPATKSNLTNQDSTTNTPSPLATNNNSATNVIEPKTETPDSTPMEQKPIQAPTPQHPNNASTSSATMLTTQFQPQQQPQQQTVTVEKYNHVKNTLKDMWKQVKTLEASSVNETQTKKEEIDRKITELRNQMQKYHTAALRMKSKLIEQGTIPANSTPIGSPTPVSNTDPTPIANTTNTSNVTPPTEKAEENSKPNVKPPSTTTTTTSKSKPKPLSTTATNSTTKTSTPSKGSGSSKSNNRSSSQNTPGTSTSASATKTASVSTEKDAPLTATTSTSAVAPAVAPAAATVAATTAPTAAAAATSLSTASAITTKSTADPKVTPSNIPDNDGRVLTKRKLVEMINNISIDQGDAKIPIDNDVEDIFLDLADEFVRNVVQFSGRLAKHRKLDRIDVRDVQLNLERNWGLRIPGYSTDEIRAARKWQPEGEYAENVKKISKLNKDQ